MKIAWTKAKLEEICRPKQWKTLSSQDLFEEGFPVYGANGIIGYYSAYTHENPTVMITCRGATCGTINLSKPKSYISGNAMALDSLDESKCFYRFLMYFLRYRNLDDTITGSAQPQITRASLKNVEISLPPVAEQRRIADILDCADAVRRKRKEAIALTEELLRSAFLEMFGDPATNPKGWQTLVLNEVCTKVTDGTHHMPKTVEDGIPILRALNVKNGRINKSDLLHISESDYEKIARRSPLEKGDILLTCLGTVGTVAIFEEESRFSLVRNIALLKPNYERTTSEFLEVLLKTNYLKVQIKSRAKQSSQAALYIGEIEQLKIFVPPIELQRKFSKLSKNVYKLCQKLEQDKFQQNNLFDSLLQRAFWGEL